MTNRIETTSESASKENQRSSMLQPDLLDRRDDPNVDMSDCLGDLTHSFAVYHEDKSACFTVPCDVHVRNKNLDGVRHPLHGPPQERIVEPEEEPSKRCGDVDDELVFVF